MGTKDKLNPVSGIITLPVVDGKETMNFPVPEGMCMIRNGMILIASKSGMQTSNMEDHRHPNLATATHTHIRSDNNPWMMCNPQLWYYPDVKNHPELVVLNGQELDEESARNLSKYYYGNRTLTEAVEFVDGGFSNNEIIVSTSTYTGSNTPDKLFGPDVDITNGFDFADQWLTGNGELTSEQHVEITFKGNIKYLPKAYRLVPASGTPLAEIKKAPTPNTWVVEGKVNESWITLDSHTNVTEWVPLTPVDFTIKTEQLVSALRLKVTKWNAGADVDSGTMATGLRRFYVFGRKEGKFSVPDIKSPDEEFVWVIPKSNLNIGLKHEDVGDFGLAVAGSELPAYRHWCNGELISSAQYPLLDIVLQGRFDPENKTTPGTSTDAVFEYTTEREEVLSKYEILLDSAKQGPLSWTLEGESADGSKVLLHTVTSLQGVEVTDVAYLMRIDNKTPYSKYVLTITAWKEGTNTGFKQVKMYTHPQGKITLPNITTQNGLACYIVSDICATDVSAEVISALQKNVVDLATTCAKLQDQINQIQKGQNS